MPTKHNGSQTRDFPVIRSIPRPVDERLGRMEDLLLEMRHEQDVMLKRLAKAQAQLERIFDLYYTTKPGGSGIGLSMVFRIVQLHGGEIGVESTQGRGTTFRLLLPRA